MTNVMFISHKLYVGYNPKNVMEDFVMHLTLVI